MLSKAELNLSTDALTVEQAIEHALAVYEQNDCNMCGRQHKQLANWLTELLSLREQLAELKALPPVGYVGNSDLYALSTGTLGCIAPYNAFEGIPLFTAAKPADSVTLPAPANYEDYAPMVSLEKTMAALALCGIEYTVKK